MNTEFDSPLSTQLYVNLSQKKNSCFVEYDAIPSPLHTRHVTVLGFLIMFENHSPCILGSYDTIYICE